MTDVERKEVLRIFSDLYAAPDYSIMVQHMPVYTNDPEGKVFEEYFDFLQSLYATRDHLKEFDSVNQLDAKLVLLRSEAKKFDYPENILEAL